MKVLTIIVTMFIPLSFIAGVYGMNFDTLSKRNMPELRWKVFVWTVMILVAAVLVGFMWRKDWLTTAATELNGEYHDSYMHCLRESTITAKAIMEAAEPRSPAHSPAGRWSWFTRS